MKVKRIFSDCMAIVGCVVGIGFVTGKEAQVFVGNDNNIWVFVLRFLAYPRLFCVNFAQNGS